MLHLFGCVFEEAFFLDVHINHDWQSRRRLRSLGALQSMLNTERFHAEAFIDEAMKREVLFSQWI